MGKQEEVEKGRTLLQIAKELIASIVMPNYKEVLCALWFGPSNDQRLRERVFLVWVPEEYADHAGDWAYSHHLLIKELALSGKYRLLSTSYPQLNKDLQEI